MARMRSRLRKRREALRPYVSVEAMARRCEVHKTTVRRWEDGTTDPYTRQHDAIARGYEWPFDRLDELLARDGDPSLVLEPAGWSWPTLIGSGLDDVEAIELVRRVEASDSGPATLAAIEQIVDRLEQSYTHSQPHELLLPLRAYRAYIAQLLDGRATLAQRRELVRKAGWVSLLVATAAIDVGHDRAAVANFDAARTMAREAGDDELAAWVFETEAWQALTAGRFDQAADLCRAGLDVAPAGTSAHVQLCTQAARAWARLGDQPATRHMVDEALTEVHRLPSPEVESHFTVDQRRVLLHCAAALVWLGEGDATAEDCARRSVSAYEDGDHAHHLAVARMNLAILLATTGQPSAAAYVGQQAIVEAGWRLCHTDLFLTDDLHSSLSRYDNTADVRTWIESYPLVRREIAARQPELATASTITPPGLG